jgi:hypothetical protein
MLKWSSRSPATAIGLVCPWHYRQQPSWSGSSSSSTIVGTARSSAGARPTTGSAGVWLLYVQQQFEDTNGVERALRGVAVGRKKHYGSRSERGIRVAALFCSLIESAKLTGVEPQAYLGQAVRGRSGIRGSLHSRATSSRGELLRW